MVKLYSSFTSSCLQLYVKSSVLLWVNVKKLERRWQNWLSFLSRCCEVSQMLRQLSPTVKNGLPDHYLLCTLHVCWVGTLSSWYCVVWSQHYCKRCQVVGCSYGLNVTVNLLSNVFTWWNLTLSLTCLLSRIFDKQRGDILVHSHLVLGDAGIGSGVLIPDAANKELTTICYKKRRNKRKRNMLLEQFVVSTLFEIFIQCITYIFEMVNLQSYGMKKKCINKRRQNNHVWRGFFQTLDCWFLQCSWVRLIISLRCMPNIFCCFFIRNVKKELQLFEFYSWCFYVIHYFH